MNTILLTQFYSESSSTFDPTNSNAFKVEILLNPNHPVYKGHFEQVPIVPGVCQTQIIKEVLMEKFQVELQLTESDSLKFLAMINPQINPELTIDFRLNKTDSAFELNAVISHEKTVFTKFKGIFSLNKIRTNF